MDTLNSLLLNGNNNPSPLFTSGFAQGGGFPVFPTPFDFSMLSVNDIAAKYYNNNALPGTGSGVTIYADPENDLKVTELEEVFVDSNRYEANFKGLEVVLFAARDGAFLLEQYKRVTITPKQIAMFLEIDDSTNFTGSVMRLKIGSDVEKMKGLPFVEIAAFARSKKIDLSPAHVQEFIEGGIDGTLSGVVKFLVQAGSFVLRFTGFAFAGLATFFDEIIPNGLDELRVDEAHWKGDDLLFVPNDVIKLLEASKGKDHEKIANAIFAPFFESLDGVMGLAGTYAGRLEEFFPPGVHKIVNGAIDKVSLQIADIKKFTAENLPMLADMMLTSVKMLNAMLCGFLNSVVDFVKGIFQFVGIIFRIANEVTDFADNPIYYTDYISEIIENFVGAIIQFDYVGFFKQMVQAPIKLYNTFKNFIKNGITINIDPVTAAYYYGYIVGLIVQIIVELLLTGGTVTVAKLVEYFKAPFTAVAGLIKASFGAARTAFQRLLNFLNYIVNKLKKPKQLVDDFITFVDELLNGVKKEAGVGETVAQEDLLVNWDKVAGRSRRLGQKLYSKDIIKIKAYLEEIGYGFEILPEKGSHLIDDFFDINGNNLVFAQGKQAAFVYTAEKARLILREKATVYEIFHELMHAKHAKSIGLKKYHDLGGYGTTGEVIKERHVFDKIIENKELFTRLELEHAIDYINDDVFFRWGNEPLVYDFDIQKISSSRKVIQIDKILKIK